MVAIDLLHPTSRYILVVLDISYIFYQGKQLHLDIRNLIFVQVVDFRLCVVEM